MRENVPSGKIASAAPVFAIPASIRVSSTLRPASNRSTKTAPACRNAMRVNGFRPNPSFAAKTKREGSSAKSSSPST